MLFGVRGHLWQWFMGRWPTQWQDENITVLELFPIVAAIRLWATQLANMRIIIHTDNQALVHILNKQTSKDAKIMVLVRHFIILCMTHNVQFKVVHVPGCQNTLSDKLSRLQGD